MTFHRLRSLCYYDKVLGIMLGTVLEGYVLVLTFQV